MITKSLGNQVQIIKMAGEQATATSDFTPSAPVDTANCEGVVFLVNLGTANAANGINAVQQDTVVGMGGAANLAGTQVLANKTVVGIDIFRPRERYLWPIIERGGATTTIGGVWAILYGKRTLNYDNNAQADVAFETHVSPAEGTP